MYESPLHAIMEGSKSAQECWRTADSLLEPAFFAHLVKSLCEVGESKWALPCCRLSPCSWLTANTTSLLDLPDLNQHQALTSYRCLLLLLPGLSKRHEAAGLGSEQTVPTLPVNSSVPGRGEANPVGADGNAEASGMAWEQLQYTVHSSSRNGWPRSESSCSRHSPGSTSTRTVAWSAFQTTETLKGAAGFMCWRLNHELAALDSMVANNEEHLFLL